MTVPMIMPNSAAAMVGLEVGARAGVHSPVSACATSAEAIAGALEMICQQRPLLGPRQQLHSGLLQGH